MFDFSVMRLKTLRQLHYYNIGKKCYPGAGDFDTFDVMEGVQWGEI